MPRVIVVGAGLAGLAVAFRLRERRPDLDVLVLESAGRPGGNIWTEHTDGFTVEHGPNGIFDAKPHAVQLARDAGLGAELLPGSDESRRNRFLFVREKLHKMPAGPLGVLTTPILSPLGRLSLLAEPFRRRRRNVADDESVAAFARRRFGKEAADTFVDGLVTGIHGGNPAHLSVAAAFPRLVAFERDAGGVVRGMMRSVKAKRKLAESRGETPQPQRMWSFRRGLRVLVEGLVERLGGAVRLGVGVTRVEPAGRSWVVRGDGRDAWPADAVVLTCPAFAQAELVADAAPKLAEDMAAIRYNRIAVVALGYRRTDVAGPQDGFGYIAPQNTRRDVLGVQWCSSVFPDRAPPGMVLWRALCGGVTRADVFDLSDDELVKRVHAEVQLSTGVTGEPVFRKVVRWPRAIPQYEVGHPARVARLTAATPAGLFLGGNAYRGVALSDCGEQGEVLAEAVAAYLPAGGSV